MAHVELSLSEPGTIASHLDEVGGLGSTIDRWAFAVAVADEPCLLLDASGLVVSASPGCGVLFGIDPAGAVGRHLVGDVLHLLDFSTVSNELPDWEVDKIPPLLALTAGGLARGLLRIACDECTTNTVDAISAPLREGGAVVGSLTFFASVNR